MSLSESRDSISSLSDSSDCSLSCSECSCCDSGLSGDSLNSNDIRPRSEISSVHPSWRRDEAANQGAEGTVSANQGVDGTVSANQEATERTEENGREKSRRKRLKKLLFHKKCKRNGRNDGTRVNEQSAGPSGDSSAGNVEPTTAAI